MVKSNNTVITEETQMKEIAMKAKYRVIELFLTGYTLDEIDAQLHVSKGSVVHIVDDFR